MERVNRYIGLCWVVAVSGFLASACITYEIDTTLEPDGGGVRRLEVVVDESGDEELRSQITGEQFTRLMNLSGRQGWTHLRESRDGDPVHVFRREARVESADDWSRIGGRVQIDGALPAGETEGAGYVSFGDVRFRNSIEVELRDGTDGRTLVYRERFEWTELLDALVEQHLVSLSERLRTRYPDLGPGPTGELIGLYRAGFWWAIDRGLLDAKGEEGERLVADVSERVGYLAAKVVGQSYPAAEREFFVETARHALDEGDDEVEATIESKLPGVRLAGNTAITVRLQMPGRIVESNAHDREGSTLKWEFSPWDAAAVPLELYAETVISDQ